MLTKTRSAQYRNNYGKVVYIHEFRFGHWGAASLCHGQPVLMDCFPMVKDPIQAEKRLAEVAVIEGWERL